MPYKATQHNTTFLLCSIHVACVSLPLSCFSLSLSCSCSFLVVPSQFLSCSSFFLSCFLSSLRFTFAARSSVVSNRSSIVANRSSVVSNRFTTSLISFSTFSIRFNLPLQPSCNLGSMSCLLGKSLTHAYLLSVSLSEAMTTLPRSRVRRLAHAKHVIEPHPLLKGVCN